MVSVDFVGVRWGGIGQIAKSGVGTPPHLTPTKSTLTIWSVWIWGGHREYKIHFRTIDDTVSDDNGPPRSVTKMSVCGQSTMVVINETD